MHQLRAGGRAQRVEAGHRRGEIGHVEAALQVLRQIGADEVDQDLVALLAQVDRRARIGELDDQAAGGRAIAAAAEIDVLDAAARRRGRRSWPRAAVRGSGRRPRRRAPASPSVTMMRLPSTRVW